MKERSHSGQNLNSWFSAINICLSLSIYASRPLVVPRSPPTGRFCGAGPERTVGNLLYAKSWPTRGLILCRSTKQRAPPSIRAQVESAVYRSPGRSHSSSIRHTPSGSRSRCLSVCHTEGYSRSFVGLPSFARNSAFHVVPLMGAGRVAAEIDKLVVPVTGSADAAFFKAVLRSHGRFLSAGHAIPIRCSRASRASADFRQMSGLNRPKSVLILDARSFLTSTL